MDPSQLQSMTQLSRLKAANSFNSIAGLLNTKPSALAYILYKLTPDAQYSTFLMPKRHGGTRTISAPTEKLRMIQSKLSMLLQDCLDEIRFASKKTDHISHGFMRDRSILTNARRHRNRRYVFNLDLEEFFPSINFGRVRGFFISDRNFELHKDAATTIARIACHNNTLPQGSPCSPVISNLIAHLMDIHLVRLASRVGCTYTRYADDITFSTNKKEFPGEIATCSEPAPHEWLPGNQLLHLIKHSGFKINSAKTRMQYKDSRQDVTGLVVNKRINVPYEYRRTVRAMVHSLFKKGTFEMLRPDHTSGALVIRRLSGTLDALHGRLGFIDSVDLQNRKGVLSSKGFTRTSNESMYRRFLIYKDFYNSDRPVILCEGETDNVYLKFAIKALASQVPELVESADTGFSLKVRLYKYTKSSTSRILGLNDGGSSALSSFIGNYRKDTDKFEAPGLKHPVIILYDDDDGARNIQNAIKGAAKRKVAQFAPYVHIVKNLYAMPTPKINGNTTSKIEDFFDDNVKLMKLGGKSFTAENTFDTNNHYGKRIFAEQVVQKHAPTIDFSGFKPILGELVKIIRSHEIARE